VITGRNQVIRVRRRLDQTFARIGSVSGDVELQGDFAKYLCILVSNYVENAVAELVLEYVRRRAAPPVVNYVERQLSRFTNPNVRKICDLLGGFEADLRREFESFVVDEREAAINSIVAIRNQIAHGESAGVSYARIKSYYDAANDVVDHLASLCDPIGGHRA
jgi:hypothetical protein